MAISSSTFESQVFGSRATEIFRRVSGGSRNEGEGRVAVDAGFSEGPHGMPTVLNPALNSKLVQVREQQRRQAEIQDAYRAADEVNSKHSRPSSMSDGLRKQRLNRESEMHQQAASTRNWVQR